MGACDDLAWLDALNGTGDCNGDVDALMDWIASPTASSGVSRPGAPFSDFWTATTTHAAAEQCNGQTLAAASQHQPSSGAAQQKCNPQLEPDTPWPFPAIPTPAPNTIDAVDCVVSAQQDWLRPAGAHGAAADLLFSPGSSLSFPIPAVTAAPAGLSCTPPAAPSAQAAGAALGPYPTMLQAPPSLSAAVPVWNPSMQHSQFSSPAIGTTCATPFGCSAVQQPWLDPSWTHTAPAVAAPYGFSTGMYAGINTPPYPSSRSVAPFGACAQGCGLLPFPGPCMHAAAPGMGNCPPVGLSCTCMQSQYAIGGQTWQDQSSACSSGSPRPMQLPSASSSPLLTSSPQNAGTAGAAGAGAESVAAVLAAAALVEEHLARSATLGRSGSGSCLTAAGALQNLPLAPAPPAAAAGRTAGPTGAKPSPSKGSAQAAGKRSAQMKPPAPRLVKPPTKVVAKAGHSELSGGGEVDDRLQALASAEGDAKMEQLSSSKSSLQATMQNLQDSNAQLRTKLSTLRGMVSTMAADNHQLQADNSELREQVQAVVRHLQQKGIPMPDLSYQV